MSIVKLTACKFQLSCAFSKTLLVICENNIVRFIADSLAGWNRAVICSLHMENNIGSRASNFGYKFIKVFGISYLKYQMTHM